MGGPTAESYRAAEAARKKRLAAKRRRDGVIDLAEWRAARQAAEYLQWTHRELPLLLGIRVVASRRVGLEIEVKLARDAPMVRACVPASVNDVPVRVVIWTPECP